VRRYWTLEPKEKAWLKATPRNLGAGLNARGGGGGQAEGAGADGKPDRGPY